MLTGMGEPTARRIERARASGRFTSIQNLAWRARLDQGTLELLADADALASLNGARRAALWDAFDQPASPQKQPLFAHLSETESEASDVPLVCGSASLLPPMSAEEQVGADYRTVGLSLRAHPLTFHREQLDALGAVCARRLREWEHNQPVCVAGLVLMRQRPSTAKGITFVTLEDETGVANLVIRVSVWERYYQVARRSSAMIARGMLERKGTVIHVVVQSLHDLAEALERLS